MLCLLTLALLAIPFIAFQLTEEVKWSTMDFVIAASLIFSSGLVGRIIYQRMKASPYRNLFLFLFALLVVLIWAELAVGLFNSPISGS